MVVRRLSGKYGALANWHLYHRLDEDHPTRDLLDICLVWDGDPETSVIQHLSQPINGLASYLPIVVVIYQLTSSR
jgi:hypothetical protein